MSENKIIPRPKGHFLLGNLREFKADTLNTFCNWHRDHGDLVAFRLATQQLYLISHPALVEQALIKQNDVFVKMYDPEKPRGLALILGQGLLTSQGDLWRRQRRLMQPVFQRRNLASMLPQMTSACSNMLQRWRQLGDGAEVNLANEIMRLALEVITQSMFSTSVLDKVEQIAPALDTGLRYAARSVANPLTPPLFIPTAENRRFKQARALMDEIIYGIIRQRREQPAQKQDLLEMLLNATDENSGEKMSDRQIRDEVITIFTAGHETTANLLGWTFYLLARHPESLQKLRTEVDDILQGKTADIDSLQQLTYSRAVLNEAMRVRPPAGIVMRKIVKDTELDGHSLKAGSLAVFSIYNIHHHPDLWPQPDRFNPERFLTSESRRFAFMPFGAGERVCIGNHFAMTESLLLLSMIVQHHDMQLLDDREIEPEMAVSIRPKGGIPVCLKRRGQ